MNRESKVMPIAAGIVTCTIFGLSFLFSKKALNVAEPLELLSFRFLTAFLVMSILIIFKIIKIDYRGKNIQGLLLLGLMQPIIYFILEAYGIKLSSSSQAGLMIALIPIFVTIMSAYFLKEKPTVLQVFFIILSVLGVMFIVLMGESGSQSGSLLGTILLLGAALSSAVFTILSRKLSSEFTPMELTYSMMLLGTISFNLASFVVHIMEGTITNYFKPLKDSEFIISIAYLGILSSIIAFFLINYTLSKIEASKFSVLSNISTIVSVAAGVVLLNETFMYYHIIGSIMIIAGVWGTNYFGIKK